MKKDVLHIIRENLPGFSKGQKRIADKKAAARHQVIEENLK